MTLAHRKHSGLTWINSSWFTWPFESGRRVGDQKSKQVVKRSPSIPEPNSTTSMPPLGVVDLARIVVADQAVGLVRVVSERKSGWTQTLLLYPAQELVFLH
jgi:hypothetical protein